MSLFLTPSERSQPSPWRPRPPSAVRASPPSRSPGFSRSSRGDLDLSAFPAPSPCAPCCRQQHTSVFWEPGAAPTWLGWRWLAQGEATGFTVATGVAADAQGWCLVGLVGWEHTWYLLPMGESGCNTPGVLIPRRRDGNSEHRALRALGGNLPGGVGVFKWSLGMSDPQRRDAQGLTHV